MKSQRMDNLLLRLGIAVRNGLNLALFFVRLRQINFNLSNSCYTRSSITFSEVNQPWPGFVVLFLSLPLPSSSTSHLTFLMFKVVSRTGTTVTRTSSIPSLDTIAFLRSAGVTIEWSPWMYFCTSVTWSALLSYHMDPYRPVGCRNRSRGDPTWSFLIVICTLLWWFRSGSCLHCLGGIQLSVTWGVHPSSFFSTCSIRVTTVWLFCKLNHVHERLRHQIPSLFALTNCQKCQEIPLFSCTGWVRTSWRNPVWSAENLPGGYRQYPSLQYPDWTICSWWVFQELIQLLL